MHALQSSIQEVIEAIDDCLQKRRILPCLILLYCAIDAFAELENEAGDSVQTCFVRWVNRYLIGNGVVSWSAIELYAARCGVVHTFSAESRLSETQGIRKVTYAWGTAKAEQLNEVSKMIYREDCVAIHLDDLIGRFRRGLAIYLDEVSRDKQRLLRIEDALKSWFVPLLPSAVDALIARRNTAGSK